ncbi:helix-turn-helix transcriptional regulator [Catenovulum agarivorans]|nr:helix-turn-helix transcriptional regulator [Catenovulum agarivorans]
MVFSVIPLSYLTWRLALSHKHKTQLIFLLSSLSFAILFVVGLPTQKYWLYYIGSIITAGGWFYAVYQDIKAMKAHSENLEAKLAEQTSSNDVIKIRQLVNEESPTRAQQIVEQTIQSLTELYQHNIEAKQLADKVNVSESYLMRNFKKHTGKTIKQFLTEYRITQAKKLLPHNSVTDTAFAVGFNNSNYFSTVFKKTTGLSPQQYIEKQTT